MSEQLQLRRGTQAQLASFVGAQGEPTPATDTMRLHIHDGATAGGWPHALESRSAVADANYAVKITDRQVAYTALTAARTASLPAAAAYPTGAVLLIIDESGACSASKTITISRAGADTINGASSAAISQAYGFVAIESNGANAWTIVDQSGFNTLAAPGVASFGGSVGIGTASPGAPLDVLGSLQTHGGYGSTLQMGVIEDTIACSGASSLSSQQIPNRAIVLAVSTRVVTAIAGATSFNVDAATGSGGGAGGSSGQFGGNLGVSAGSTNIGVIGPTAWYAASAVKLTANGGNFTGGQVRVAIQYLLCGAPTA